MTGRRSLGWTYNQAAKTKAAEALERSRREAAAAAEMSRCAAEPSNELSRAREGSHKRTGRIGDRDELAFLKSFASDDDILAGLIKQQELVDGLMKLLKISDASVDKATGLVEQLMGDNAKLLKLVAEKEEEAAGWKMLHEQSSASEMTLKAVVEELMGGLRKLRIEREQEVEESVAAFKQSREELKKELEDFAARRSIDE